MENYRKARTVDRPSLCPFTGLPADTPEVRVKDGSKIRNLLRYALSRMEVQPRGGEDRAGEDRAGEDRAGAAPPPGRPACGHMVFTASGKGVSKAITCAEIVKRRVKGLHQLTRLLYGAVEEVWEPLQPAAGLDSLTVSRNLPAIWILLSREPLDCSQPGYQAPGRYDALWAQTAGRDEGGGVTGQRPAHKRKKGGGAGGGAGGGGGGAGGGGGRGRGAGRQAGRAREAAKGQT